MASMVRNVHSRRVEATPEAVGVLLDSVASPDDRFWPTARWPAMRLDSALAPGSRGGHGPIRYSVVSHVPGREVVFRFGPETGLIGDHRCEVVRSREATVLRHVFEAAPTGAMRLLWPLAFRWMHDALIEDALDRAEADLSGKPWHPRSLGAWVRIVRAVVARAG